MQVAGTEVLTVSSHSLQVFAFEVWSKHCWHAQFRELIEMTVYVLSVVFDVGSLKPQKVGEVRFEFLGVGSFTNFADKGDDPCGSKALANSVTSLTAQCVVL